MTTKDPIAAELGRRGGIKGGKARSMSLSPERRREIARRAAAARWGAKASGAAAEAGKASLPGVATAVRRGTMQLADRSFEVFALADGRQLLGLLSVEAALATGQREASVVAESERAVVTFKEVGSWQVAKGVTPADFVALCQRLGLEALRRRPGGRHDPGLLERLLAILIDAAGDGLKRRVELALRPV